MTENCSLPARKHGRHPAAMLSQIGAADRIDALPDRMQPAGAKPMFDALPAMAEIKQLAPR